MVLHAGKELLDAPDAGPLLNDLFNMVSAVLDRLCDLASILFSLMSLHGSKLFLMLHLRNALSLGHLLGQLGGRAFEAPYDCAYRTLE